MKPHGIVGWRRENFYLYGAVEPATGESFFWEFSHLDSSCFQSFLDKFSQQFPDSLNLLQLDNGSFHKSVTLNWPDNILPIFQPAHSPEQGSDRAFMGAFQAVFALGNLHQLGAIATEVDSSSRCNLS